MSHDTKREQRNSRPMMVQGIGNLRHSSVFSSRKETRLDSDYRTFGRVGLVHNVQPGKSKRAVGVSSLDFDYGVPILLEQIVSPRGLTFLTNTSSLRIGSERALKVSEANRIIQQGARCVEITGRTVYIVLLLDLYGGSCHSVVRSHLLCPPYLIAPSHSSSSCGHSR